MRSGETVVPPLWGASCEGASMESSRGSSWEAPSLPHSLRASSRSPVGAPSPGGHAGVIDVREACWC